MSHYDDLINLALDIKDYEWAKKLVELNDNFNSDKINDKSKITPLAPLKYTEEKDDTIYKATNYKVVLWATMVLKCSIGYHQIPDESNFKKCVLEAIELLQKEGWC